MFLFKINWFHCLSVCPSICLTTYLCIPLSVNLSICLSIYLHFCPLFFITNPKVVAKPWLRQSCYIQTMSFLWVLMRCDFSPLQRNHNCRKKMTPSYQRECILRWFIHSDLTDKAEKETHMRGYQSIPWGKMYIPWELHIRGKRNSYNRRPIFDEDFCLAKNENDNTSEIILALITNELRTTGWVGVSGV